MNRIYVFVNFLYALFVIISPAAASETEGLTLQKAITLAVGSNPELASSSWEIRARQGRARQAATRPNPELEVVVENFWGGNEFRSFDAAEFTLAAKQLIELGGKRSKRAHVADVERELAAWDHAAKELDVINDVTKSFIEVAAGQRRLEVSKELFELAEQSLNAVSARVQAGRVSPIEESRASAEVSKARIEMERAERSLSAARKNLSILLADERPFFERVDGGLELDAGIPPSEKFLQDIDRNPDVARWSSEIEQRRAILNLERANRMQDPSVSLGVRRLREADATALVAAISFPVPLFNRNSGAVSEAESRLKKAEEERKAALSKTETAVTESYLTLSDAFVEATTLKNAVIPELQAAFNAVQEGYRYGKFGYLDLIDAQRSLSESKNLYIESLAAYGKAYSEIRRLTGTGPELYGAAPGNIGD